MSAKAAAAATTAMKATTTAATLSRAITITEKVLRQVRCDFAILVFDRLPWRQG